MKCMHQPRIKVMIKMILEHVFSQFLKYHMKIMSGDFNAKIGREDIFKQLRMRTYMKSGMIIGLQ